MQNPLDFYNNELTTHQVQLKKLKKRLLQSGLLRFFIFGITIFLIYLFFENTKLISIIGVLGLTIFLFLIKRHEKLKNVKEKATILININKTEINVIENNAFTLETGTEYSNPNHKYSYDIDLFGKASFFQHINRTATQTGKDLLAKYLSNNHISEIKEKQKTIVELANKPKWRQEFTATARMVEVETKANVISKWMQAYRGFTPSIMQYLPSVFLAISILFFVLNLFNYVSSQIIVLWFIIGLGISGYYFKKVSKLSLYANQAKDTFRQYYKLLQQIETTDFEANNLVEKQNQIKTNHKKASEIFEKFSKSLNALDQRNNLLIGILGNGFALMDVKNTYDIEKWITTYKSEIEKWFAVIAFFDAQNSLANYRYNHPDYVFPEIASGSNTIQSIDLGHPLLHKEKRIDNDFNINKEDFFIITGANMAGKSTFLRTVSLSIIMANAGLPVCAKSFSYSPIKLITSMRTTDSLSDDESYFFSELKRLKFIKDAIKDEKHFIVLDEILKGTNSTDKAIGSRKFVKKLVESKSTGIIATHDLSLCEIADELNEVKNYYFDAEIINDELYFDYKMKTGICQNMNASFLLNKMGIV